MLDAESLEQIQQVVTDATQSLREDMAGIGAEIRQEMAVTRASLREEITESKRHTGVLVEGLCHDIQLVTEGVTMHLEGRHTEEREYLDRQFAETNSLLQLSYSQPQERVDRLEQRVRSTEQHLGLSA